MALLDAERRSLDERLRRFDSVDALRRALQGQLRRRLFDGVRDGPLRQVVADLIELAEAEGWLAELHVLRWEVELDTRVTDLAHFDLDAIEHRFLDAYVDWDGGRPFAVAVVATESSFFDHVCRRLAAVVNVRVRDQPVNLDPVYGLPVLADQLDAVGLSVGRRRYLVPVLAHAVEDAATVHRFWADVCERFAPADLIGVLSVREGQPTSDLVVDLPPPTFTEDAVAGWVRELGRCVDWDARRRAQATRTIWGFATGDRARRQGDPARPHSDPALTYRLYSALESCVEDARTAVSPPADRRL